MGGDVLDDGVNEGLYNGNIAVMVTGLYHPDSPGGLVNGSLANAYQYDQLNRIKQMQTWYRAGGAWTRPGGSSGIYKAEYDYDKNGNLDYLARRVIDRSINPWSSKSLDDLEYNYPQDGFGYTANNKLTHVEDNVPVNAASDDLDNQGAGNYTYDAIGNLIANDQEEIATITWDLYNKVRTVQRSPVGTSNGRADLQFWYDGMGNRVRKRVIAPLDGGADTLDTWYVRDPQDFMRVGAAWKRPQRYEQALAGNVRETRVSEFALYGAKRLGLCYVGDVVRRTCVGGPCEEVAAELDPASAQRALLVREVMYDSPVAADSLVFGERHDGEFVVVENAVGRTLDLAPVRVVCAGDTLALSGTLGAEETLVIGFAASAARFAEVTQWDTAAVGQRLVLQEALALPDGGGEIELWYAGARIDRVVYGDFHGLVAENDYLSPALLDSLGQRRSLNGLRRIVGGSIGIGPVANSGTINVEPVVKPWQGRYTLFRGQKAYEEANHLGNVLAVVSDLKLGREIGMADSVVDFYVADVRSLSDYWPFGAPLQERQFGAERYRFGFQRQEHDDEVMGLGNAVSFKHRVQDARLGRFLSVDPLAPEYPWYSPYQFAGNRAIQALELEGLEPVSAGKNESKHATIEQDATNTTQANFERNGYYVDHVGPENDLIIDPVLIVDVSNAAQNELRSGKSSSTRRLSVRSRTHNSEYKIGEYPFTPYEWHVLNYKEKLYSWGNWGRSGGCITCAREIEFGNQVYRLNSEGEISGKRIRTNDLVLPLVPTIVATPLNVSNIARVESFMQKKGGWFNGANSGIWVRSHYTNQAMAIRTAEYYFKKANGGVYQSTQRTNGIIHAAKDRSNGLSVGIRYFNTNSPPHPTFGTPAATITISNSRTGITTIYKFNY